MTRGRKYLAGIITFVVLCSSTITSYASLDSYMAKDVFGIHTYTSGTLLYDSADLQPRYGPGFQYQTDDRFEMKKGSSVRIFSITKKDGYTWALTEASYNEGSVWIYLLCNDPVHGELIRIDSAEKVITEDEPNYSHNECYFFEDDPVRLGPGEQFPAMKTYDHHCQSYVIATCQGWALIELRDDDFIGHDADGEPLYYRGWIPKDYIDQY